MNDFPAFTKAGVLPLGDYELTIDQLRTSALVAGPDDAARWNAKWRLKLVDNLAILVGHLAAVGITEIFIDGSFVEKKDVPNDIDGYFICDANEWAGGRLNRRLRELDPVWTWEQQGRSAFRRYPKPQLPMWHKYRVELFPDYGQFCGLFDGRGRKLRFADAFRLSRQFKPKGIVKIGGLS